MSEVTGVGHSCYDFLCTVKDYPEEDKSTHILSIDNQGGGAVATAMVAVSVLGINASFIGNVGCDDVGNMILDDFRKYGVDTSCMTRLISERSLVSYVMINQKNGSRTKFPFLDQSPAIVWDQSKKDKIKNAKILHLDGTHYENALNAATIAKEGGVLISLDGCRVQQDNAKNKRLASMTDILIMNSKYPLSVTGCETLPQALLEIGTWGPQVVVATAGADGIYVYESHEVYHYPAYPVKTIDSTGAGDVFHGAFLKAYLSALPLEMCLKYASVTAALKCRHIGGREGIPMTVMYKKYAKSLMLLEKHKYYNPRRRR